MKKIVIFIIVAIFAIAGGTYIILSSNKISDTPKKEIKTKEVTKVDDKPAWVDDNPNKVGLYIKESDKRTLIKDYKGNWTPEVIIGVFNCIYTNDETISGDSLKTVWESYLNNYDNADKYKIGYNIKFTYNGEIIDKQILNPDDAYTMFPKLMFFLYDDYNYVPGTVYSHVEQQQMKENTVFTSVKLVGDVETYNITSPIELTAFTYKGDEDFDKESGKYRGSSSYTIIINKK